jgi:hypothetical protein
MNRILFLSVIPLVACIGCGGPAASVQGTVTIDGQLARQGTVVFHPVAEDGPVAYGSIADDGSYALRVGQGDLNDPDAGDVPLGEYIVTVVSNMPSQPQDTQGKSEPPTPGARLSAEKYGSKDTSDLRHTVKEGRNVVPLELEGASADEAPEEAAREAASAADATPAAEPADEAVAPPAEASPENAPSDEKSIPPDAPPASPPPANESEATAVPSDTESSATEETP